jgi:hypothetical protein
MPLRPPSRSQRVAPSHQSGPCQTLARGSARLSAKYAPWWIRISFFVITFRLFGSLALPAFLFLSLCYVHLLHEAQIGCLNGGAARVV